MNEALNTYVSTVLGGLQTLLLVGLVGVIALLLVYRAVRG